MIIFMQMLACKVQPVLDRKNRSSSKTENKLKPVVVSEVLTTKLELCRKSVGLPKSKILLHMVAI